MKRYFYWSGGALIEHGDTGYFSDQSTAHLAGCFTVNSGDIVVEPGCGSGMISVLAAKLGASTVYATDLDSQAVEFAKQNVIANGTPQVTVLYGDLLDPIPKDVPIDIVVSLLPHRPSPYRFNMRFYGGWDGTDLIIKLLDQCENRLKSGAKLYLYHNSIANPRRVKKRMEEIFLTDIIGEWKRDFTWEEFDGLAPGMMLHLIELRSTGQSIFEETENGFLLTATVYLGTRR